MNIDKRSGYCGIDCSKCDAYIATITNDEELKKKTSKVFSVSNLQMMRRFYLAYRNQQTVSIKLIQLIL